MRASGVESGRVESSQKALVHKTGASKFWAFAGSANWVITLGRLDICYAVQALSRYNMAPREGHLDAMTRIFGYLKKFPKGKILVDDSYPDHSCYDMTDHPTWKEFYPDTEEELAQ